MLIPVLRRDFPVLKIILSVLLADRAHDPAWIAHCHHICGNILCNDASGADDGVIPDGDAGHDDCPCAEPAVPTDMDRHVVLVNLLAQFWQDGVSGGGDGHVGTDHRVIPDVNMGIVHAG